MDLIVAVYDDWGIGKDGTQPIALSTDRKFFREMTRGAMVIAGRRTIADFPGQKPLPGRVNVAVTRSNTDIPGFTVCHSPEEAAQLGTEEYQNKLAFLLYENNKNLDLEKLKKEYGLRTTRNP